MDGNEILDYKLIKVVSIIHIWLLKNTHFLWLDALTMPLNNPINNLLINTYIILYYVLLNIYRYW